MANEKPCQDEHDLNQMFLTHTKKMAFDDTTPSEADTRRKLSVYEPYAVQGVGGVRESALYRMETEAA